MISGPIPEPNFAAAMTNRQFAALRIKLRKPELLEELKTFGPMKKIKKASNFDEAEVRKWLMNGWNTEYLLRSTRDYLPSEQLINAIQWAFPQAYYAAFTLTLAFFKTVGQTEYSHASVIRKFGDLVADGKYPSSFQFLASGAKPVHYIGIGKSPTNSSLSFNAADPSTIATQICQFLSGTRQRELVDRRKAMKFEAKSGKKKKNLTAQEWEKVSDALGYTSLLSLLYRKRIKSNYQEIDTFLSPDIEAEQLFEDLIHVVACINFVHETFIAQAIGITALEAMLPASNAKQLEFVATRLKLVREIP